MKPVNLLAAVVVAALSVAVGVEAQGLGDAAKREKERRSQTAPKVIVPAKTYTGDDILGLAGGEAQYGGEAAASGDAKDGLEASASPASLPAPAPATGSVAAAASSGSSDRAARGESYWRSRAQSARAQVAAAETRLKDLEAEATRNGPFTPGPTGVACQDGVSLGPGGLVPGLMPVKLRDEAKGKKTCSGEVLRQQRGQALQSQVEAARQNLASSHKALEDLEDEARRGGAQPGWLR